MGKSTESSRPDILNRASRLKKFHLWLSYLWLTLQIKAVEATQQKTELSPEQVVAEVLAYVNRLSQKQIPLQAFPVLLRKHIKKHYPGVPIIIDPVTHDVWLYKISFETRVFFNILPRLSPSNAILTE